MIENKRQTLLDEKALLLNNAHQNKTLFILGNGPQLASLTQAQIKALKSQITIGVNHIHEITTPTYFLTGYTSLALGVSNRYHESDSIKIQMVDEHMQHITVPNFIRINKKVFNGFLNERLSETHPYLITKYNVIFGATHLAYIMGAKKIIYLGVEQRNIAHAIDYNQQGYGERIKQYQNLRKELSNIPELSKELDHVIRNAQEIASLTKAELSAIPLTYLHTKRYSMEFNHLDTFTLYFQILNAHGIESQTTVKNSILTDANIDYVDLNVALCLT